MWNEELELTILSQGRIRSVLVGHKAATYGASFVEGDRKCITWSSDSTLRAYDLSCSDAADSEAFTNACAVRTLKDVSLFSCCVNEETKSIICGGGTNGKDNSFLGMPIQKIQAFW